MDRRAVTTRADLPSLDQAPVVIIVSDNQHYSAVIPSGFPSIIRTRVKYNNSYLLLIFGLSFDIVEKFSELIQHQ